MLSSSLRLFLLVPLLWLTLAHAWADRGIQVRAAPAGADLSTARRTALIIGNGGYRANPLRNPPNDARDVAEALKRVGFRVTLRIDADRRAMRRAIRELGTELNKGGVGFFFFAGHGMQVNGANYLIPVGAEIASEEEIPDEAVDANLVLRMMYRAGNPMNIVILDACRDNPFARSFRSSQMGLAFMDAPRGTLISFATAPGSVAADGTERNSPFTKHLLRFVTVPGLELTQMMKRVRAGVQQDTGLRQTPWDSSSLTGDFFFSGRGKPEAGVAGGAPGGADRVTRPDPEGESREGAKKPPRASPGSSAPGRLTVRTQPEHARVRLVNAEKPFVQGGELPPGRYHASVTADGWSLRELWVELQPGQEETVEVSLMEVPAEAGKRTFENDLGMTFVYVPPGTFMMGSPWNESGRCEDERQHPVTLSDGFTMQTTEVTEEQWKAVMGTEARAFRDCVGHCPVKQVSWNDAQAFVEALNRREGTDAYALPTEAQWEYACRAGTSTAFSGGACLSPDRANFDGRKAVPGCDRHRARYRTLPVGSLAPNPWGIFDMHGNVSEWCRDGYGAYPSSPVTDPAGPAGATDRVYRGGDWQSGAGRCRSASRFGNTPGYGDVAVGFRLIRRIGATE